MSEVEKPFEKPRWAILELFGHRKLAGQVSDVEVFGTKMCRLDIPTEPPITQFYGGAAIYGVTPTTEQLATAFARHQHTPLPVSSWELPERPALPAKTTTTSAIKCDYCDEAAVVVIKGDPLCREHGKEWGAEVCESCDLVVDPDKDEGASDEEGNYVCAKCSGQAV